MTRPHSKRIVAAFLMLLAAMLRLTAAGAEVREHREAGRTALEAGDLDKAEQEMKEAIVAAKKLGPDHRPELVEAFVGLSDVFLKQARMTEANILLEHALLLLAQIPGTDSRVLDQVYSNLATVRIFQKNIPEAESLLKRALAVREKRLGPEHVDLAEVLDRLAELAGEQRNDEDARALHARAVTVREKAPGASLTDVITVLKQGAEWYGLRGYDDQAEAIWRRLLPLQEKALGAAHRDVADTLMKIVGYHLDLGSSGGLSISVDISKENLFPSESRIVKFREEMLTNFREHEPMLARALAIREQALGLNDADTLKVAQYLAAGYEMQTDWARAVPLFERILAASEKTVAPEDRALARPLAVLAGRSMTQHRYRDAIPLLKRLAAIQAAEKASTPKENDPLAFYPTAATPYRLEPPKPLDLFTPQRLVATTGGDEADDPNDAAALLRKATRLANLEQTPDVRPTEQDLSFFKSEGWDPPVADLSALLELTSVVLPTRRVENATLAHIRGLVNLRSLVANPVLSKNTQPNIDDTGLVQLRNLTALTTLDLQGTAIRGPGLSALEKMTELRSLNLSFTRIDDAGLAALPSLASLESLDLSSTEVSDQSLPVLKKLTGLKQLHIFATRISEQGAADLRGTPPSVMVLGPKVDQP